MEPPLIPIIEGTKYDTSEKYCVKIKLRRDPTPQKSDLFEFEMTLFDNHDPNEFLLIIGNFNRIETEHKKAYLLRNARLQFAIFASCLPQGCGLNQRQCNPFLVAVALDDDQGSGAMAVLMGRTEIVRANCNP